MSKKETAAAAAQDARIQTSHQWWNYAAGTARALTLGDPPPTLAVQGIVLDTDEDAYLHTTARYARFYAAGDGSWTTAGAFVVGRPAVIAGAAVGAAIANARARSAAQTAATPMWRENHTTDVLLTSKRAMAFSASRGQWLSFWYHAVSEFYPDLNSWTVSFAFPDTSPLRLSGPASPAIALWTARGILGDRWRNDPRLTPMLGR